MTALAPAPAIFPTAACTFGLPGPAGVLEVAVDVPEAGEARRGDLVIWLAPGGDHDWTEILSRWGLLAADTRLAGLLRLVATLVIVAACVWLWRQRRAAMDR